MEGEERREKIVNLLAESQNPVSGSELAKTMGVSRQVIVQDIALLRAINKNILSTNKGYIIYSPDFKSTKVKRTIAVNHDDSRMQEELYLIVDYGGTVLDVVVEHDVYGQITGELILRNRQDVDDFIDKIKHSKSHSLLTLTDGNHFHTIETDDETQLLRIEEKLRINGFLQ